jgi:DNA-binding IclR family transcriptional regulator
MMDEEQAMRLIRSKGLTRYTPRSIIDLETYVREIRSVKDRGFAVDDEEYLLGVRAVAAPIQGVEPSISAIWVVGFKASLDEEKMKTLVERTRDAGRAIREKIEAHTVTTP